MKILSLDLGITSVGSSLIDFDENNLNNTKILHSNIRLFQAPKTSEGESKQKVRGEKKRSRNNSKNSATRRKKVTHFILKNNLVDINEIKKENTDLPKSKKKRNLYVKMANYLFKNKKEANNILYLRHKALFGVLTNLELARLLFSMENHRGVPYEDSKSLKNLSEEKQKEYLEMDINAMIEKGSAKVKDLDKKKLIYGQLNFKNEFEKENYLTVGEFLYQKYKNKFRNVPRKVKEKRNKKNEKGLVSDFLFVIPRKNLVDELKIIFDKQIELKNNLINGDMKKDYIEIFEWENDSPSYQKNVSPCSINNETKAASKYKIEAILYIYLEKLYNLSYKTNKSKKYENLQIDEILVLIKKLNIKEIKYYDIKNILEKELSFDEVFFKGVDDYKKIFLDLKIFKELCNILNISSNILEIYKKDKEKKLFNSIVEILAYTPKTSLKEKKLNALNLNIETIDKIVEIKIKGHLSYCEEVLEQICNGMLSGLIPHYAKEKVEDLYHKEIIKTHLLPPVMQTDFPIKNNHTVVRALSQMRLVVNETLTHYRRKYNNPNWFFDRVIIETGKDFLNEKQVEEYRKINKENEKANKQAIQFCEKYGKTFPSKQDILKARLFIQQKGLELYPKKCQDCSTEIYPNNLGQFSLIKAERLFDETYCEIDHIIPINRSLDDSFSNKTLVLSSTNQNKGNKTPFEYLDKNLFEIMEEKLKNNLKVLGFKKVENLTNKDFKGLEDFSAKDLNNTRIITKYAGLYLEKYLSFPKDDNFKRRVFANNGKITSLLRKSWGIGSKNRNNHLHHAEDAILIALSNNSLIKHIATFYGIQTQLENFNFSRESFDKLFKNEKNLKNYIIEELKKQEIYIDNLNIENINKKELVNKIFKIIAKKSYPQENFLEHFKNTIDNSIITHKEEIKINGHIHSETIEKISQKTPKDAVLVRGGACVNGETLRYDVFKAKEKIDFIRLTPKYHNKLIDSLPKSSLKNAEFLFSIYKNTLLEIDFKKDDNIYTKRGLFSKIDADGKGVLSYMFLESISGEEDEFMTSFISNFEYSYKYDDSITKEVAKSFEDLVKKNKIEITSTVRKIETIKQKISNFIEKLKEEVQKLGIKKLGINILSNSNILEKVKKQFDNFYIKDEKYEIILTMKAKLVPSTIKIKLSDPKAKTSMPLLLKIKKIKSNTFGDEVVIDKEERKELK